KDGSGWAGTAVPGDDSGRRARSPTETREAVLRVGGALCWTWLLCAPDHDLLRDPDDRLAALASPPNAGGLVERAFGGPLARLDAGDLGRGWACRRGGVRALAGLGAGDLRPPRDDRGQPGL